MKNILALLIIVFGHFMGLGVQKEEIKIINWNVLYGFNHHKSIDLGIDWLKTQTPDIVAFQELNGHKEDGFKKLATKWGHNHAVMLKEKGFPVGLTSNAPIEVIERQVKGFHHGYLHCKTKNINLFVVHFWPGKEHESKHILKKMKTLTQKGEQVIILGDFNAHSRSDQESLKASTKVKPIYQVTTMLEGAGYVDIYNKHNKINSYSFPSPIIIPRWAKNIEELKQKRQRIDFIFADKTLSKQSKSADIIISKTTDKVSDHYPIVVTFTTE